MWRNHKEHWRRRDRNWILSLELHVLDWFVVSRLEPHPVFGLRSPFTRAIFSPGCIQRLRRACGVSSVLTCECADNTRQRGHA